MFFKTSITPDFHICYTGLCITGCYVGQSDLNPIMLWDKIPFLMHYFACELGSKLTEVLS